MAALMGLAQGFFGQRTKMIEEEREKEAKLTEQLKAMHMAGLEAQQQEYDKRKAYYDQMEKNIANDRESAAIQYLNMHGSAGAEAVKKFTGKDTVADIDYEATIARAKEDIAWFREQARPEFIPEEYEKIQARRGVDNLRLESWLRENLGIKDSQVIDTPYKAMKNYTPPPPKEDEQLIKYREEEVGNQIKRWNPEVVTKRDGSRQSMYVPIGENGPMPELARPGLVLQGEQAPEALTKREVITEAQTIVDLYKLEDPETQEILEELVFEAGNGKLKRGPGALVFEEFLNRERAKENVDIAEATTTAFTHVANMIKIGMYETEPMFSLGRFSVGEEVKALVIPQTEEEFERYGKPIHKERKAGKLSLREYQSFLKTFEYLGYTRDD